MEPSARIEPFGLTPGGDGVEAIVLTNAAGMQVRILTLGATIQSVLAPDRNGKMADVVLGYADAESYCGDPHYFGATIGRVGNRIAGGRFELDGERFQVICNDGPNTLHGGCEGFDSRCWSIAKLRTGSRPECQLRLVSPDGDQGFPGTLEVAAAFTLEADNRLAIEYTATTDRPTVVNLTNHSYWNLQGDGSEEGALGHLLQVYADEFLPIDAHSIPTGEVVSVDGGPFDFRQSTPMAERISDCHPQILAGNGYDHCWSLRSESGLRIAARLADPVSGRVLEVFSDKPGLQVYSGNFLGGSRLGKSGRAYRPGDGIALEPQDFPDSPNQPQFGSVRLGPGDTYQQRIEFRFSTT